INRRSVQEAPAPRSQRTALTHPQLRMHHTKLLSRFAAQSFWLLEEESMLRMRMLRVVALTALVLVPAIAYAQTGGIIAGVVRDASGGVMPGVTIEAMSPALIEKVRSSISDSSGQY